MHTFMNLAMGVCPFHWNTGGKSSSCWYRSHTKLFPNLLLSKQHIRLRAPTENTACWLLACSSALAHTPPLQPDLSSSRTEGSSSPHNCCELRHPRHLGHLPACPPGRIRWRHSCWNPCVGTLGKLWAPSIAFGWGVPILFSIFLFVGIMLKMLQKKINILPPTVRSPAVNQASF